MSRSMPVASKIGASLSHRLTRGASWGTSDVAKCRHFS